MVLSNKRLKQKLRAALAGVEPVAVSGAGSNIIPQTTVPKIADSSLKEAQQQLLLDSPTTQKLRLSKREKRRKIRSSNSGEGSKIKTEVEGTNGNEVKPSNGAVGDVGENPDKRKKKRKRSQKETEESVGGGEGDGEVKKKKKKKKKTKNANNKKKKKWSKKDDKAADKKSEEAAKNQEETQTAVAAADSSQVNNGNDRRKVYVGGIPYYSSEDDIRSYFESCGTITELDCMMFPESGKFRGIAIITFKTEEAAKRALALDGADMGGLFLKIQLYNKPTRSRAVAASSSKFVPPVVEGYNRIYMGNLSWDISEDEIRKFLSGCNISSIRFGMDKVSGEFRGYAHVDFSDSLSMNMAMKLDQQILCGRPVKVTSAIPKNNNLNPPQSLSRTTSAAAVAVVVAPANYTRDDVAPRPETYPQHSVGAVVADASVATADAVDKSEIGVVSSGKMRRRTCYVCGEKGHISSACPQQPADDPTNSTPTL